VPVYPVTLIHAHSDHEPLAETPLFEADTTSTAALFGKFRAYESVAIAWLIRGGTIVQPVVLLPYDSRATKVAPPVPIQSKIDMKRLPTVPEATESVYCVPGVEERNVTG
jgi:hypothetical protein